MWPASSRVAPSHVNDPQVLCRAAEPSTRLGWRRRVDDHWKLVGVHAVDQFDGAGPGFAVRDHHRRVRKEQLIDAPIITLGSYEFDVTIRHTNGQSATRHQGNSVTRPFAVRRSAIR